MDIDIEDNHAEDVPVYEPAYPEYDRQCSHMACTNERVANTRLCEECVRTFGPDDPDSCPHCSDSFDR